MHHTFIISSLVSSSSSSFLSFCRFCMSAKLRAFECGTYHSCTILIVISRLQATTTATTYLGWLRPQRERSCFLNTLVFRQWCLFSPAKQFISLIFETVCRPSTPITKFPPPLLVKQYEYDNYWGQYQQWRPP